MLKRFGFYAATGGVTVPSIRNMATRLEMCLSSSRHVSTAVPLCGRTPYSYMRTPRSMPNIPVPKKLKDGTIRRHGGRSGRNNSGHIVVRHRGGGHSQTYRIIDFLRAPLAKRNDPSGSVIKDKVLHIGYDPCRSARIALVAGDGSNQMRIITAPDQVNVGDVLTTSRGKPRSLALLHAGDAYPLESLPVGTLVHNIELRPGEGAQLVRAAGTYAQLVHKTKEKVKIRLPSKKEKEIPAKCLATVGRVSNLDHKNRIIGKAGRNRWLNRRPKGQTGRDRWLWKKKRVWTVLGHFCDLKQNSLDTDIESQIYQKTFITATGVEAGIKSLFLNNWHAFNLSTQFGPVGVSYFDGIPCGQIKKCS